MSFLYLTPLWGEKGVGETPVSPWRKAGYSRWKTLGFQRAGGDHIGVSINFILKKSDFEKSLIFCILR